MMIGWDKPTPTECWNRFARALHKIFSSWTLLCLAVEQGWGGKDSQHKATTLEKLVLERFQIAACKGFHDSIDIDELANFLAERIVVLFSAEADDNSDIEVAEMLVQLFRSCGQGDFSLATQLEEDCAAQSKDCKRGVSSDDDLESSEDESVDNIPKENIQRNGAYTAPDADGWCTATTRRRR